MAVWRVSARSWIPLLAACWCLSAGIAAANDALPQTVGLKELALDLQAESDALESQRQPAAAPALSIYLSLAAPRLAIVAATVAIDEGAPASREFSAADDAGFRADGLALLAAFDPPPGAHRIQAHVEFRAAGEEHSRTIDYAGELARTAPPARLELQLDWTLLLGTELKSILWTRGSPQRSILPSLPGLDGKAASRRFEAGSSQDPQIRNAAFQSASGHSYLALRRLLQAPPPETAEGFFGGWRQQLAESAIRFGALSRGAETIEALGRSGAAPKLLAPLRIRLAESLYRREQYDAAEVQLTAARHAGLPREAELDWLDLRAQLALAQGRYDDAGRILLDAKHELRYADYVRYFNLGAALIRDGQGERGATVLDRVGRLLGGDHLLVVVRDEANLQLGWYFLRRQQGRTALPILERVSLEGPQATRAILGIGWAWLAPPGGTQQRAALGDERTVGVPPESQGLHLPYPNDQNLYQRYKIRPFAQARIPDDEQARLKRALAIWAELPGRDRDDPAVQEGLAAIALALDHLGAHEDAAKYLEQAVAAMAGTRDALVRAGQYIVDGRWIDAITRPGADAEPGSDWIETDLPAPAAALYLQALIAGNRFQQALHDCRDLELLRLRLEDSERRLGGFGQSEAVKDLRSRIARHLPEYAAAEAAARARLQALALDDLQGQGERNELMLTSARFRLARTYDRVRSGAP